MDIKKVLPIYADRDGVDDNFRTIHYLVANRSTCNPDFENEVFIRMV